MAEEGNFDQDPDTEIFKTILDRCRRKFVDDLDPIPLLDVFLEEDYITYTKERDIKDKENTSNRNREILQIVRSKDKAGYVKFKICLRKSRQDPLANHLETIEIELNGTIIRDENAEQPVSRNKGYTCSVCDLSYDTIELLVEHTESREHLNLIQKQETFAKEIDEDSTEYNNDNTDISSINEENEFVSTDQVRKCYICDVVYTSPSHAKSHLSGKHHKKRKRQFEIKNEMSGLEMYSMDSLKTEIENVDLPDCGSMSLKAETMSPQSETGLNKEQKKSLFCDVCEVTFTGIESAKQHNESDKHKKKVLLLEKQKKGTALPLQFDICKSSFSGQENAEAHFNSEKHKKKASSSNIERPRLSCDLCNCTFTGLESATDHFNSRKHKKKEFEAQSEASKTSLSLSCTICNCSFSSEENAKQHYEGKKHKKALAYNEKAESSLKANLPSNNTTNNESSTATDGEGYQTADYVSNVMANNEGSAVTNDEDNKAANYDGNNLAQGDKNRAQYATMEDRESGNESYDEDLSKEIESLLLGDN